MSNNELLITDNNDYKYSLNINKAKELGLLKEIYKPFDLPKHMDRKIMIQDNLIPKKVAINYKFGQREQVERGNFFNNLEEALVALEQQRASVNLLITNIAINNNVLARPKDLLEGKYVEKDLYSIVFNMREREYQVKTITQTIIGPVLTDKYIAEQIMYFLNRNNKGLRKIENLSEPECELLLID